MTAAAVLVPAAGYLLGSIPVADLIVGRRGPDLRTVGDRNPGYWNAKQVVGRRAALPVLAGDTAKGALAASLGRIAARRPATRRAGAADEWWLAPFGTAGAMLGHCWPLFAGFRGGRGVATFVGGALVTSPISGGIGLAVVGITWGATRSFAPAVRAGFVAYTVVQLGLDGARRTAATGALMTLIGIRFATAARANR